MIFKEPKDKNVLPDNQTEVQEGAISWLSAEDFLMA
jgi:hypothetical protein